MKRDKKRRVPKSKGRSESELDRQPPLAHPSAARADRLVPRPWQFTTVARKTFFTTSAFNCSSDTRSGRSRRSGACQTKSRSAHPLLLVSSTSCLSLAGPLAEQPSCHHFHRRAVLIFSRSLCNLQNITRDLLSLCLLLYPLPPPPEQEQARTAASSPPAGHGSSLPPSSLPTNAHASSSQLRPTNDKDVDDTDDSDDPDRPRRELEEAHEDDDDDDDDEEDPADAERDPADRTDGDTDGEDESGSRASQSSKGKGRATSDSRRVMRPIDCLSIVIIACWTIKVPVMFTDFIESVPP